MSSDSTQTVAAASQLRLTLIKVNPAQFAGIGPWPGPHGANTLPEMCDVGYLAK